MAVGTLGGRLENEADKDDDMLNAEATASVRRVLDRVRYSDSNGPTARRISEVSGLREASHGPVSDQIHMLTKN